MKVHEYDSYPKLKTFLKDHIRLLIDLGHKGKPAFTLGHSDDNQRESEHGSESQENRSENTEFDVPDEVLAML